MALIRRAILSISLAIVLGAFLPVDLNLASTARALHLAALTSRAFPSPAVQATVPVPTLEPLPTAIPSPTPRPSLTAATTVLAYPSPPIQARAAFLVDMETGKVLYEKNANMRLPMASTTKITTAILTLQHGGLSHLVTVSNNAATIGQSTMALVQGERVTVLQLLYGLLLNSGNDAAIALAEHVGGTEQHFVQMMNRFARTLHMRNTHYVTPHGLDVPGHYTSAHDLATVAAYAMRDPVFRRIVESTQYYIPPTRHNHVHWLGNINRVMYWYPGVNGIKPGDTDNAGLCQVVSVYRDGRRLLAVLLNTPTLVTDIRNLLDFGLHDFRWVQAPAWWDSPAASLTGGSGSHSWIYYLGAGHYIRGLFLAYFRTHGGLETLGYPRTEELKERGRLVQYFEGGVLAYDPAHRSVYPVNLGRLAADRLAPHAAGQAERRVLAPQLRSLYRQIGGRGVLGRSITPWTNVRGAPIQFFQYGALTMVNGIPDVVPLGDVFLRQKGWLRGVGAANSYPATMTSTVVSMLAAPPVPRHVVERRADHVPARGNATRRSRTRKISSRRLHTRGS